jgi:V8-like Glu-specific endopeptidase
MATNPLTVLKDIPAEDASSIPKPDTDVVNPFSPVKVILIDSQKGSGTLKDEVHENYTPAKRLPHFQLKAEPTLLPRGIKANGDASKVAPSAIFYPDNRQVFEDSRFPFSLVGKVRTAVSTSCGTVVGPRHVLVASSCVNWTRDQNGNIGWMSFTPSYYNGRGPWGEFAVMTVIKYRESGSRLTDEQTAWDFAVCVLREPINTKVGGTAGTREYNGSWNGQALWQSIGYSDDLFNGERPEYQSQCSITSNQLFGRAQLLGHFNDTRPGQGGAPVWGYWPNEPAPSVVGVVSTSPDVPQVGSTAGDNECAGGAAMVDLVLQALRQYP